MIADENGLRPDLMEAAKEKVRVAMSMDKLAAIKILSIQYPNDMDFGAKVRELISGKGKDI